MKTLEELGISPWPWRADDFKVITNDGLDLIDYDLEFYRDEDAALVSAAPDLYECLRDAVSEYCHGCARNDNGTCTKDAGACFVHKWCAALEKAGGAE